MFVPVAGAQPRNIGIAGTQHCCITSRMRISLDEMVLGVGASCESHFKKTIGQMVEPHSNLNVGCAHFKILIICRSSTICTGCRLYPGIPKGKKSANENHANSDCH